MRNFLLLNLALALLMTPIVYAQQPPEDGEVVFRAKFESRTHPGTRSAWSYGTLDLPSKDVPSQSILMRMEWKLETQ